MHTAASRTIMRTTKMAAMETLEQIQQTLSEIDKRVPDALRAAFLLGSPAPAPGEDDDVASLVASVLPPPGWVDGDGHPGGLEEVPLASEDWRVDSPEVLDEVPLARQDGDGRPDECHDATRALRMDLASCYLPLHDHDSHFGLAESGVLGVADGVGGYSELGVDAGAFSNGLMTSAFVEVLAAEPGTPVCPYTLLERAYEETAASGTPGASTAVILSLAGKALRWAYIGDSAFAVLRDGAIVHRSRPQQSYFNCPYQLCANGGDSIAAANAGEVPVRDGDVVVTGTDGLFDNMFDAELERVVRMGTALGFSPRNMADVIAGAAYEMSRSQVKVSPFSIESQKQRGGRRHGGKEDDITVVVAFIVSSYS